MIVKEYEMNHRDREYSFESSIERESHHRLSIRDFPDYKNMTGMTTSSINSRRNTPRVLKPLSEITKALKEHTTEVVPEKNEDLEEV